jgi:hypothetical protein
MKQNSNMHDYKQIPVTIEPWIKFVSHTCKNQLLLAIRHHSDNTRTYQRLNRFHTNHKAGMFKQKHSQFCVNKTAEINL